MDWTIPIILVVVIVIVAMASRQVNFRKLLRKKPSKLTDEQKEIQKFLIDKIRWGQDLTPSEEVALESIREITTPLKEETEFSSLIKNYRSQHRTKSNSHFFPEEVPIISYEKNGMERRISFWTLESSNVIRDNERGKAADLGKARPVSLVVFGKAMIAFEIDGDHGVGININMSTLLAELTTTAEEAWSYLESGKLAKIFTDNLTARQTILYIVIGIIAGQLIFWIFKI